MTPDDFARSRIEKLLQLAKEYLETDEVLSKRYVTLARRIAMRHRIKLGNKLFCKKCGILFVFGKTVKARTSKGRVLRICLKCNRARQAGRS